MFNLIGMVNPAGRSKAPRPASVRPGGVDVSDPIFGIGALMLVTVFPYFYPTYYVDVRKYWGLDAHLTFAIAFASVHLALYALYASYLRSLRAAYRPVTYTADFADLLLSASRCAVWIAMLTNFAVVAYVLPRYQGYIGDFKHAFGELGGVNILTQLHLCFLGPFIGISIRRGSNWKLVVGLLCLSLTARSFILSERMALMEMAVPLIVILCLYRAIRVSWWHLILMVLAVPVFFVAAELMRSFSAKFVDEGGGWGAIDPWFALGWNLERLFIYYIDVVNKFYFVLETQQFGTSQFWWKGTGSILSNFGLAKDPTAVEFSVLELIMDGLGVRTPEMTNFGGFTQLMSDFGWFGFLVYLGLVLALFATHAGAVRGSMLCVGLYPLMFLNFADMARRIILYESRALFPLAIFLASYGVIHIMSSAVPLRPHAARPLPSPSGRRH